MPTINFNLTDIYVTGGTYSNGIAEFTNNTGGTFNVTGFSTGSTSSDVFVTGGTYSNITGVSTFTNNTGGTFNVSGFFKPSDDIYVSGTSFNNGNYDLIVSRNDGTDFTVNLSTLASDVNITGGTYNQNTGVVTFTNNTGGTFNVSGFITGLTDTTISSYTYDNANTFTITDSSGGTFNATINSVTGLTVNGSLSATTYLGLPTDVYVTGGTYSNGIATFTNNTGGTFNLSGLYTGATDVFVTGGTYSNGVATFINNTGGTFNVSGFSTGSTGGMTGITVGVTTITSGTTGSILMDIGGIVTERISYRAQQATPFSTAFGFESHSSPSFAGNGNTSFGYQAGKALTTGNYLTFIGYQAGLVATSTNYTTGIGYQTFHNWAPSFSVCVGSREACGGNTYNAGSAITALGYAAMRAGCSGSENISIGAATNYNGHTFNYCGFIGSSSSSSTGMQNTASNQFVIGMPLGGGYQQFWLGQGVSPTSSPAGVTLNATPGSGTNNVGGSFTIAAGMSTGTGNTANILFKTSTPLTGSSSTQQTLGTRLTINQLGLPTFTSIHNNTSNNGNASNQDLRSGTYSPTRSNEVNLDSNVTFASCKWFRVGNIVSVSGRFTADPTMSLTLTSFEMTLPVASNLAVAGDVSGVAFNGAVNGMGAEITCVPANDTALVTWFTSNAISNTFSFNFSYEVI